MWRCREKVDTINLGKGRINGEGLEIEGRPYLKQTIEGFGN